MLEERSSIIRINDLAVQYQVKDYTVNAIRNINLEIYKKKPTESLVKVAVVKAHWLLPS